MRLKYSWLPSDLDTKGWVLTHQLGRYFYFSFYFQNKHKVCFYEIQNLFTFYSFIHHCWRGASSNKIKMLSCRNPNPNNRCISAVTRVSRRHIYNLVSPLTWSFIKRSYRRNLRLPVSVYSIKQTIVRQLRFGVRGSFWLWLVVLQSKF